MEFVIEMLRQGFQALGQDGGLLAWQGPVVATVRLAVWSTAIAVVLGLPVAYWLASGTSRARRAGRIAANAGLGLPPVGVGVYAFMLLPAETPFGGGWYGTMTGMVCVQTVLALPIIVALCATALLGLPDGLVDQARAFGGRGWRLAAFTIREAKVGVVVAVIVSMAAAIGEVGAITIISGYGVGPNQTLATSVLDQAVHRGGVAFAIEDAIRMLALLLVLGAMLTIVQQSRGRRVRLAAPRAVRRSLASIRAAIDEAAARLSRSTQGARPALRRERPRWARAAIVCAAFAAAAALVGYTYRWQLPGIPQYRADLRDGLSSALSLAVHPDPDLLQVTWNTVKLALTATALGAIVGLPAGCALGVGRFRGRRLLLGGANGLTKVPPVVIGIVVLLLFTVESQWGGGPLAGVSNDAVLLNRAVVAQTLLAIPIITVLTATAVQAVSPGLLEQARAFGAPGWRRGMLALREARAGILAGVILAMGVTITAVGALTVGQASYDTLAPLALTAFDFDSTAEVNRRPAAVAYATILFALFVVIASVLTIAQRGRRTRVAARAS